MQSVYSLFVTSFLLYLTLWAVFDHAGSIAVWYGVESCLLSVKHLLSMFFLNMPCFLGLLIVPAQILLSFSFSINIPCKGHQPQTVAGFSSHIICNICPFQQGSSTLSGMKRKHDKGYTAFSLLLMHQAQSFPFPLLKQGWKIHQEDAVTHFKICCWIRKWNGPVIYAFWCFLLYNILGYGSFALSPVQFCPSPKPDINT